ncbi:transcription elongation factor spt4 [Knufia obscura]|uniref:Transcription elongation factor SPT4 n=2 Tax=Knufia TaxID=430999 RepID=A0AAN8I463_9EURO|nr:transcription elongation factor spt4 [Knufia obscura]KAK5953672.1 transcription elongation factor spt4 [Knufia fluminis]
MAAKKFFYPSDRPTPAMSLSRTSRACMVCSIVQTQKQFYTSGCPNCEEIVQLRGSEDAIAECTSKVFDSLITLADPKTSWVAKWLRLSEYVPAVYAVKVNGSLPGEIIDSLENNGIKYVPRDGTEPDEEMA